MARDVKWAINEACGNQQLIKISLDEGTEKEILAKSKSWSIKLFFGSLAFMVVVIGIVVALAYFANLVIISVKGIGLLLLSVIFPFYAIYNIIATFGAVKKGDYDFYSGTLVGKTDKGYHVAGLEDQPMSFIKNEPQDPKAGDPVIVIRVRDELSLLDNNA